MSKILKIYLEKHPRTNLNSVLNHFFRPRTLPLPERYREHPFAELHAVGELVQISGWICARREDENQGNRRARLFEHRLKVGGLGFDELLAELDRYEVLHGVGDFVGAKTFQDHHFLESIQSFVQVRRHRKSVWFLAFENVFVMDDVFGERLKEWLKRWKRVQCHDFLPCFT